jgi:hypothetical protein
MFQKSLYRKARYKNHLPLKYCIAKFVQNVCKCAISFPHSCTHTEICFNTFKQVQLGLQLIRKQYYSSLLDKATFATHCIIFHVTVSSYIYANYANVVSQRTE